jgi:hypothetical protein
LALAFDEFGRPFIMLREQEKKTRLRGLDAQKANIAAGKAVARILRTSLGPKGVEGGVRQVRAGVVQVVQVPHRQGPAPSRQDGSGVTVRRLHAHVEPCQVHLQ